ncbi:MAG: tetratricopeptide repeat protein [Thermodesulfobacteriota bacterium]
MNRQQLPVILLFLFFLPALISAADKIERDDVPKSAEIISVAGEGWMRFVTATDWQAAVRDQALSAGDAIRTGDHGRMGLLFTDGIQIKVNRNTLLAIQDRQGKAPQGSWPLTLNLRIGEIWSRSKTIPDGMRVETPSATAAIRGTDWDILVDEQGRSYLTVIRGSVELGNDFGRITVGRGEQALAEPGQPPRKTMLFTPAERIQWTYPADIDLIRFVVFHSHRTAEINAKLVPVSAALEKNPEDAAARLWLAGLLFDLGSLDDSLSRFDEILKTEPRNPSALVYKGMILLKKGATPDTASALFDQALAVATSPEALVGKAEALLRENRWQEAYALLRTAEDAGNKPIAGLAMAAALAYTGSYPEAEKTCREYRKRHPGDERFPVLLGSLYVAMDELGRAREEIKTTLADHPDYGPAFTVLAAIEYLEGNAAEAEAASRKALELNPADPAAKVSLGVVLTETGHYEEARETLDEAVALNPGNPLANAERGLLNLLTERTAEARSDLDAAYAADPTYHPALNCKALALLKEGETDAAIDLLLASGVIEPKRSQTHSFLAVAYHQKREFEKALAEIELAAELDPRDSLPHLIANYIHQDTYRPFEAITASRKALELLPYQKSLNVIEDTRAGTANVGSALLGLGMNEWADSFAQEGYDTFRPSSHFQSSRRYHDNHYVNASELLQGLILDPMANYSPMGYSDIIRRPRHDAGLSASVGDTGAGVSKDVNAAIQGYVRSPMEIAYALSVQANDLDGEENNDFSRGGTMAAGIGIRPDYRNAFHIGLSASHQNSGDPGSETKPDPDDEITYDNYTADLGYTHRFGVRNRLLCRGAYDNNNMEKTNPYPFGSGMGAFETSFITAGYTPEETQEFFRQGVYDISGYMGGEEISLATDSTGTLAADPLVNRLAYAFPAVYDDDVRRLDGYETASSAFQARHILAAADHELSWGLEYVPFRVDHQLIYNELLQGNQDILFYEDPLVDPEAYAWRFPLLSAAETSTRTIEENSTAMIYAADRWTPTDRILVDAGLFGEQYDDTYNDDRRLYPRIGTAVRLPADHVLRCAYQQWLEKPTIGTLSPLATAGLVPDNSLGLLGSRIEDFQARFESRWTDRLFTVIGAELSEIIDPEAEIDLLKRELYLHKAGLAVNAILTDQLGAYARFSYAAGEYTEGIFKDLPLQYLPERQASGGLVWVSPRYVKTVISENYIGRQYTGYSRESKLPEYYTTDLRVIWEPLGKRAVFTVSVLNLFNQGYPAPDRTLLCSAGVRF